MRNTASFELFPDAPSERVMARARYLVREGRLVDAERAYREVLAERSEEHTSELQSQSNLVCRLLLEKKKTATGGTFTPHPMKGPMMVQSLRGLSNATPLH